MNDISVEAMELSASPHDEHRPTNSSSSDVKEALHDCGSVCMETADKYCQLNRTFNKQSDILVAEKKKSLQAEKIEKLMDNELKRNRTELDNMKRAMESRSMGDDCELHERECKRLKVELSTKEKSLKELEAKYTEFIEKDQVDTELLVFERNELLRTNEELREQLEHTEKRISYLESELTKCEKRAEALNVALQQEQNRIPSMDDKTLSRIQELETQLREFQSKHDTTVEKLKTMYKEKMDVCKRLDEKNASFTLLENQNRKLQASCKELQEENKTLSMAKDSYAGEATKSLEIPKENISSSSVVKQQVDASIDLSVAMDTSNGENNCHQSTASHGKRLVEENETKKLKVIQREVDHIRSDTGELKKCVEDHIGAIQKIYEEFGPEKLQQYFQSLSSGRQMLTDKYNLFVGQQMKIVQHFATAVKTLEEINNEIKNEKSLEIQQLNEKVKHFEELLAKVKNDQQQSSKNERTNVDNVSKENEYYRNECAKKQFEAAQLETKVVNLENQLAVLKNEWDDDKQLLAETEIENERLRQQIQSQPCASNIAPIKTAFDEFLDFYNKQNSGKRQDPQP